MYNEGLKAEFIRNYTKSVNTANVCTTIFNATEPHERKWNADICTQNETVLQPVIDEMVGLRARSKWMTLIILKDYCKWCLNGRVENACDGLLKIDVVGLKKIRYQTVSSPAHLEHYLNEICEPVDKKTTDNIYRCYYWLAYAGVREKDILSVKCSDVDFSKMVVKYDGMEVPIYREAVPAFKNCIELTQFAFIHPLYSADVWKDRAPGDTIIRGTKVYSSIKSMRAGLSKLSKEKQDDGLTDMRMSYYRVWISGLFYRTYEKEQIGIQPDFRDIVSQQREGKTYKLDKGRNTQDAKLKQLARDYLEDYQRWKLAYGIGNGFRASVPKKTDIHKRPITWEEFKDLCEEEQIAYIKYITDTYDIYLHDLAKMFGCNAETIRLFCHKYGIDAFKLGRKLKREQREPFYKFAGMVID